MGEASYKSDTLPSSEYSSERSVSSSSSSVCIASPAVNLNTASAGAEAPAAVIRCMTMIIGEFCW